MTMATANRTTRPLEFFLGPLKPYLEREDVSEVSINRPGELFIEEGGEVRREETPDLTLDRLRTLAELIAQNDNQTISSRNPLLSAEMPGGERVQVVLPPATETGKIAMSIRRQVVMDRDMEDYEADGSFEDVALGAGGTDDIDDRLTGLLRCGKTGEFMKLAVAAQKNILISGGTNTGKTTFLNNMLRYVPDAERLITIEDVREVRLAQPNVAHLIASRGGQGVAEVDSADLMKACLRLRPNRIILGELRGGEAGAYLRAVNSGHPGSITSVHADTPAGAFEQIAFMVLESGSALTMDQVISYARSVIDIVVQWQRNPLTGRRYVSNIDFAPAQD